jgi:prevent-host-death family protein
MGETMNVRRLRANLADAVTAAADGHVTTITRDGQAIAALVPTFMLAKLEEWEDEELCRRAEEAEAEPGERVTLTQMMADVLGEPE